MDISKLADNVLIHLKEGGLYSDLTDDSIRDIICAYLTKEYNTKLNRLSIKFDLRIISGEELTQEDYDKEFAELKESILQIMNDISRIK